MFTISKTHSFISYLRRAVNSNTFQKVKDALMWYVYILQCSNGDYYKGCTNNIERRFAQHQHAEVISTRDCLPVTLIGYTTFRNQQKAYAYEKYLKSGSGRAFLNKHLI